MSEEKERCLNTQDMLRFACFKGTFSKIFRGSIPETPPKKLGRFAPSKTPRCARPKFQLFFHWGVENTDNSIKSNDSLFKL